MNNFVWEADAWLHGYTYLPHFPGDYIDAIPYHGRAYVYQAPLPAVLLLPFVAVWGLSTNQTLLAIALAALGVATAWRVARRIGVSRALGVVARGILAVRHQLCVLLGQRRRVVRRAIRIRRVHDARDRRVLGRARAVAGHAVGAVRGVLPVSDAAGVSGVRDRAVAADPRGARAARRRRGGGRAVRDPVGVVQLRALGHDRRRRLSEVLPHHGHRQERSCAAVRAQEPRRCSCISTCCSRRR